MKEILPGLKRNHAKLIIWFLKSLLFAFVLILLVSLIPLIDHGILKTTEPFGNAINGITAPFIGILVAILTFLAFYTQYQANEQQRADIKLERFENKFYEALQLHRANVAEMEIDGILVGRKCFQQHYDEFLYIYHLLNDIISSNHEITLESRTELDYWLTRTSYRYFFGGININTIPKSTNDPEYTYEKILIERLVRIIKNYNRHKIKLKKKNKPIKDFPYITPTLSNNKNTEFIYTPFQGHVANLGHYYRHLYQMLKLSATDKALNEDNKDNEWLVRYRYMKLVRAQLSNHEQAMVYFNSFHTSGAVWWEDKDFENPWTEPLSYFIDYAIIKNIPLHQIKEDGLGPDPEKEFNSKISERKSKNRKCHLTINELFEQIGG